jgi:hypothetical protein
MSFFVKASRCLRKICAKFYKTLIFTWYAWSTYSESVLLFQCRVVSCRVVSHLLRIGAANVDLGSVHSVDTPAHLHTLSVGQSLGVEERPSTM